MKSSRQWPLLLLTLSCLILFPAQSPTQESVSLSTDTGLSPTGLYHLAQYSPGGSPQVNCPPGQGLDDQGRCVDCDDMDKIWDNSKASCVCEPCQRQINGKCRWCVDDGMICNDQGECEQPRTASDNTKLEFEKWMCVIVRLVLT